MEFAAEAIREAISGSTDAIIAFRIN